MFPVHNQCQMFLICQPDLEKQSHLIYISLLLREVGNCFPNVYWPFFPSYLFIYLFFCPFCLFVFRAAPAAYGDSQAMGLIGAEAAGQRQSHSNARSELHLRPAPQLMATLDP